MDKINKLVRIYDKGRIIDEWAIRNDEDYSYLAAEVAEEGMALFEFCLQYSDRPEHTKTKDSALRHQRNVDTLNRFLGRRYQFMDKVGTSWCFRQTVSILWFKRFETPEISMLFNVIEHHTKGGEECL